VAPESQNHPSPKLFCWTPRNGWSVEINRRGRRATTGRHTRPPRIAHGLGVLRGYRPRARVLAFGQTLRIRCADVGDFSSCGARDGVVAFTCTSRSNGLTCRNAVRHGYWIGRLRGYRLF
jgi:hypothetical protein